MACGLPLPRVIDKNMEQPFTQNDKAGSRPTGREHGPAIHKRGEIMFWIGLIVGLFVGVNLGLILCSVLFASHASDETEQQLVAAIKQQRQARSE